MRRTTKDGAHNGRTSGPESKAIETELDHHPAAAAGVTQNASPEKSSSAGCPECASLRIEIVRLNQLRDAAFLELAKAKEVSNALQLNYPTATPIAATSVRRGLEERPLRYEMADFVNNLVKHRLSLLHTGTKLVTKTLYQLAGKRGSKGDSES
jgi:hypothetical protein